jgi:hypothetical protein
MRRKSRSPQPFREPFVAELPAGSPPLGGRVAQPPPSPSGARLVRFPCGHVDFEAHLAASLRERKNAVWVCCPGCNVIAVTVAIIQKR